MKTLTPVFAALSLVATTVPTATATVNAPSDPLILTPFEYRTNSTFDNETPDDPSDDIPIPHQGVALELLWVDNSDNEANFEIELYVESSNSRPVATFRKIVPNQTHFVIKAANPTPGSLLLFRIRAVDSAGETSEWSDFAQGILPSTDVAIQSLTARSGTVGTPIEEHTPFAVNAKTFTGRFLPPGITVDPDTGTFSGTPTQAGAFRSILRASDGFSTASTMVAFRFEPPTPAPALLTPLDNAIVTLGSASRSIDLDDHFSSSGATAFRMDTTHGVIDLILYPHATPLTVANFRNYAANGDFDNSLFHRSVATDPTGIDIIQAGWFKPRDPGTYTALETGPGIPNELGFPNDRGSIAVAKQGGSPDSGTSQFYFNVTASPVLDTPLNNGGYTVFGRATTPSLAVIDAIHALPTGTHQLTLFSESQPEPEIFPLGDWPTNTSVADGAVPGPDDLVQILSVIELDDVVSYAIGNQTGTATTATTDGSILTLTPSQTGLTTFTISATDLDGNTAETSFATVVIDDIDPSPSLVEIAGAPHLAVTFTQTDDATATSYEVQKSTDLTSWTTIWQTSDGSSHPNVVSSVPAGASSTSLTVRTPDPVPAGSPCHLRVQVTFTPPSP